MIFPACPTRSYRSHRHSHNHGSNAKRRYYEEEERRRSQRQNEIKENARLNAKNEMESLVERGLRGELDEITRSLGYQNNPYLDLQQRLREVVN